MCKDIIAFLMKFFSVFFIITLLPCFLFAQISEDKKLTIVTYKISNLNTTEGVNKLKNYFVNKEYISDYAIDIQQQILEVKYVNVLSDQKIELMLSELGFIFQEIKNTQNKVTQNLNIIPIHTNDETDKVSVPVKLSDEQHYNEQIKIKKELNHLEGLRKNAGDKGESTETYDSQIQELIKSIE